MSAKIEAAPPATRRGTRAAETGGAAAPAVYHDGITYGRAALCCVERLANGRLTTYQVQLAHCG